MTRRGVRIRSFCLRRARVLSRSVSSRAAFRLGACLLPAPRSWSRGGVRPCGRDVRRRARLGASLPPGPEPPQAWLFAIARHKLSEALRRSRVQDEARRRLAMKPIELDEEAIEIIEATARAPAVELLENLTPAQREAIEAYHLDERGYAEIAARPVLLRECCRKRVSRGWPRCMPNSTRGERMSDPIRDLKRELLAAAERQHRSAPIATGAWGRLRASRRVLLVTASVSIAAALALVVSAPWSHSPGLLEEARAALTAPPDTIRHEKVEVTSTSTEHACTVTRGPSELWEDPEDPVPVARSLARSPNRSRKMFRRA